MRLVIGVVVCSLAVFEAAAEEQPRARHHWIRKITWAAGCAASYWDARTTATAIRRGALEANPLLADAQGAPRWGRIAGIKAGICGGTLLVESVVARRNPPEGYWIAINSGIAAAFAGAAIHNIEVSNRIGKDHPPN
jgi:hypothetical protein